MFYFIPALHQYAIVAEYLAEKGRRKIRMTVTDLLHGTNDSPPGLLLSPHKFLRNSSEFPQDLYIIYLLLSPGNLIALIGK
jgi:hypothetical protein